MPARAGAGELGPWDDKNIEEHRLVADDIERRLRGLGFDFSRSDMRELAYGRIEHLCTDFESGIVEDYSRERFDAVVDELEPTPAVAGFPGRRHWPRLRNTSYGPATVTEVV